MTNLGKTMDVAESTRILSDLAKALNRADLGCPLVKKRDPQKYYLWLAQHVIQHLRDKAGVRSRRLNLAPEVLHAAEFPGEET